MGTFLIDTNAFLLETDPATMMATLDGGELRAPWNVAVELATFTNSEVRMLLGTELADQLRAQAVGALAGIGHRTLSLHERSVDVLHLPLEVWRRLAAQNATPEFLFGNSPEKDWNRMLERSPYIGASDGVIVAWATEQSVARSVDYPVVLLTNDAGMTRCATRAGVHTRKPSSPARTTQPTAPTVSIGLCHAAAENFVERADLTGEGPFVILSHSLVKTMLEGTRPVTIPHPVRELLQLPSARLLMSASSFADCEAATSKQYWYSRLKKHAPRTPHTSLLLQARQRSRHATPFLANLLRGVPGVRFATATEQPTQIGRLRERLLIVSPSEVDWEAFVQARMIALDNCMVEAEETKGNVYLTPDLHDHEDLVLAHALGSKACLVTNVQVVADIAERMGVRVAALRDDRSRNVRWSGGHPTA